ncbi:hypothetical protein QU858_28290, partial [Escherichia coli]|nr:hypothetical protein [Escherichia coli]
MPTDRNNPRGMECAILENLYLCFSEIIEVIIKVIDILEMINGLSGLRIPFLLDYFCLLALNLSGTVRPLS